ncbi:hypothetical protein GE21DRAFT_1308582 [Neurospora crassa]|nr:hypothetical protein GE21DRAFT_1308582 [Neurospora crassa]
MLNLRSTSCPDVGRPRSNKQGTSQISTFCLILKYSLNMAIRAAAGGRANRVGKNTATLGPFDPDRAPCLYHSTAALVVMCRARTGHIRHREILDPEENLNVKDKDASTNATEPEYTSDAFAWRDLADVPWQIRSAYAAVVWLAVPKQPFDSPCTVSNVVKFRYTGTTAVKAAAEPVHVIAQCYDGTSSV